MRRIGSALWLVTGLGIIFFATGGVEPSFGASEERATGLTLDGAVRLALERNVDVLVSRFGLDRAEANRLLATAYPNPEYQFSQEGLSGGFERETNNIQYHRIEQTIEGFGTRRHRRIAADAGIEEARAEFQDTVRLLVFELKKTFYEALLAHANLKAAEANLVRFRDVVAITDLRVQHGEIPEADLIRAQVEALRFEDEVASADLELMGAKTRLALLVGLEGPVDALEIIGSLDQDSDDATPGEAELGLDRLIELAEVHRPDLAAAQARRNRADSEVKLNRALRYPNLTFGFQSEQSRGVQGNDDLSTFGLGLGVTLPIWNRNQGGIALAQADLMQAEARVRQRDQVIRAEIQSALNQFRVSAERVEAVRTRLLPRVEESRKIAEALYEEGATNLLQLLDAQRAFNEARLRSHQILFEYQVSRSLLDRAVGAELTPLGAHQ